MDQEITAPINKGRSDYRGRTPPFDLGALLGHTRAMARKADFAPFATASAWV